VLQVKVLGLEEATEIVEEMADKITEDMGMSTTVTGCHDTFGNVVVCMSAAGKSFMVNSVSQ
jgi:hypothetical protein